MVLILATSSWAISAQQTRPLTRTPPVLVIQSGISEVTATDVKNDGELLAAVSEKPGSGIVKLWDTRSGLELRSVVPPKGSPVEIRFSPEQPAGGDPHVSVRSDARLYFGDGRIKSLSENLQDPDCIENFDSWRLRQGPPSPIRRREHGCDLLPARQYPFVGCFHRTSHAAVWGSAAERERLRGRFLDESCRTECRGTSVRRRGLRPLLPVPR